MSDNPHAYGAMMHDLALQNGQYGLAEWNYCVFQHINILIIIFICLYHIRFIIYVSW